MRMLFYDNVPWLVLDFMDVITPNVHAEVYMCSQTIM